MEWYRGELLGKGSFGSVNLAVLKPGVYPPLMAVKSAPLSHSSSLQNESKIMKNFNSCPQILNCFGSDITTENGEESFNIFVEYVSGGTLASLLKNSKCRMLEFDVKRYTRSILRGLRHIHNKGYVHCDIKPENILVCSSWDFNSYEQKDVIKIADFGFAKKVDEESEDGIFLRGTPLYMAPESVAWSEYSASSDIWSLGCVVAEMVMGKPIWNVGKDREIGELLFQIGFGQELPEVPCEVSDRLWDFLNKCLVREPTQRWTAEMLLNHPFIKEENGEVLSNMGSKSDIDVDDARLMSPTSAFSFRPFDL